MPHSIQSVSPALCSSGSRLRRSWAQANPLHAMLVAGTTTDGLLWRMSASDWVHFGGAEHIAG